MFTSSFTHTINRYAIYASERKKNNIICLQIMFEHKLRMVPSVPMQPDRGSRQAQDVADVLHPCLPYQPGQVSSLLNSGDGANGAMATDSRADVICLLVLPEQPPLNLCCGSSHTPRMYVDGSVQIHYY